jgi:hypothetical protein
MYSCSPVSVRATKPQADGNQVRSVAPGIGALPAGHASVTRAARRTAALTYRNPRGRLIPGSACGPHLFRSIHIRNNRDLRYNKVANPTSGAGSRDTLTGMGSIHVTLQNGQSLDYREFEGTRFEIFETGSRYDIVRVWTPTHTGAIAQRTTERQIWKQDVKELRVI